MSAPPRILVEVAASIGSFQASFAQAARTADQHAKSIQHSIDDIKHKAEEAGKALLAAFGFSLGAEGVIRGLEAIKERVIEDERSLNRLNAVLAATGHAAGLTAADVNKIGREAADKSIFEPAQIREATTALLRFRDVQGDVFRDAVKQIPNLATALGIDPTAAAQQIGRLLNADTATATVKGLKAAGLELSQQQIDLANSFQESGQKAEGQRIKLDELTKSIAGAGEADTKGLLGATSRLSKSWHELEEALGKRVVGDNHALLDGVSSSVKHMAEEVEHADLSWQKLIARFILPGFSGGSGIASLAGTLLNTLPPGLDPRKDTGSRSASGKIDYSAYDKAEAERGAQTQFDVQAQNKEYERLKIHLAKMADSSEARYAGELLAQRAAIDLEQDALATGYARGEVATNSYYANERRLSDETARAVLQNLTKRGDDQAEIINAKIPGSDQHLYDNKKRQDAEAKLIGIINQSEAARYAFGLKQQQLDEAERASVEKLGDEYAGLFAKIQEGSGNTAGAEAIRLSSADRVLRKRFESAGNTAGIDALNTVERQAVLQASLNDEQKKYTNILDEVAIKQGYINIARNSGDITELDALARTSTANKERIADLQRIYEIYAAIAAQSKDPSDIIKAEQLKLKIADLASQTNLVGQKFKQVFENDAVNALDEFTSGTKSAKDAANDFLRSLTRDLQHMANQQLVKALANALFGDNSNSSGGNAGGLLGSLLSKLFSPGGSAPGGGAPGGVPDWPTGAGGIPEFASGTSFAPGGLALVGEHGPELVNLHRGAQVIPNYMLQAKRAERAHGTTIVNQNTTVNVLPGATRTSADQAAMSLSRSLARSTSRNG